MASSKIRLVIKKEALPDLNIIKSYKDLIHKDEGESDNMYQSRLYLADVIDNAPLYLLKINHLLTPSTVILISRMLNNRLWLNTKYSVEHEEILDIMCEICPELNNFQFELRS